MEDVVKRAAAGETAAILELHAKYYGMLARRIQEVCAVQRVYESGDFINWSYYAVWQTARLLRENVKFSTLYFTILRNFVEDARSEVRRQFHSLNREGRKYRTGMPVAEELRAAVYSEDGILEGNPDAYASASAEVDDLFTVDMSPEQRAVANMLLAGYSVDEVLKLSGGSNEI